MVKVDCCADWTKNIPMLDGAFLMSVIHGGRGYTGKRFDYCPWCAKAVAVRQEGQP